MKIQKNDLIRKLSADGYRFFVFTLASEGGYTVRDAMWNYKDAVSHIRFVHHLVKNYPLLAEKDKAGSFFIQKALGFSFPLLVLDLETRENTQTSFTSCLFFVLIIENVCLPLGELKTKVQTTYSIGAPKYLMFLTPLIAWVLKRNYKTLTTTDIPMRERRGELRRWGYRILSDLEPCSYEETLNLATDNLAYTGVAPSGLPQQKIDLRRLSPLNGVLFIGKSDHWGIKVLRQGSKVILFPRICAHEGANLDHASCTKNQMQCPWHGRKIEALAECDLMVRNRQVFQSNYHLFKFENQFLTIDLLEKTSTQEVPFGPCVAHLSQSRA